MQPHVELTEVILRGCYEVANELGVGFLETVYKNALVVALSDRHIKESSTDNNKVETSASDIDSRDRDFDKDK